MINESSSKCDISLNHVLRGRVEHLIMFCSSFRILLLSKNYEMLWVHNNFDSNGKTI
jgi:hypothetical protein